MTNHYYWSEAGRAWLESANTEGVMTKPLKPCPFCGGSEYIDFDTAPIVTYGKVTSYKTAVECKQCFARGPAAFHDNDSSRTLVEVRDNARRNWNKRIDND